MRKLLVVFVSVIVVITAGIYVFIPGTISISKVAMLGCTEKGAERIISNQELWKKWWPEQNGLDTHDGSFVYNNYAYRVNRHIAEDIEIVMRHGTDSISSLVNVLPIKSDSSTFVWKCQLYAGISPLSRIAKYFEASRIKKNMDDITASLQRFSSAKENIYGLKAEQVKVVDTLLITYRTALKEYPSTKIIYSYLEQLKNYAAAKGARQTNPPMLHMEQTGNASWGIMVAIPVDREIPDNGDFLFKRMPRGNILISQEIKGGITEVNKAYEAMSNFVNDYQRVSPGLSFMSLITDRSLEADSSKWITRIYYPVF